MVEVKVLTAIVVISLLAISAASVSAQDPKKEAIEKGLAWLAGEQKDNGAWNLDYYPVASTAFAVLKFAHHAKKNLRPPIDPFDPNYEYSENIVKGLDYIFANAKKASDDYVNGEGIYFSTGHPIYETGIVMMALEASCHPEKIVDAPGSPIDDWTYKKVMEATVDFIAWAQNEGDCPGPKGGWRYQPNDGSSDNSVSQWPVLGLMSAEYGWGIVAPDGVKTELENCWLDYSQADNGCFGYASSTGGNVVAMTASGLTQLTYCGVTTDDSRWDDARACICTNWNAGIGNYYAMYGVMKAAMTAQPDIVWWYNCTTGAHEWQEEYDPWLIENQGDDGSWPAQYDRTGVLSTVWALLILQKGVTQQVISVDVDIKPGSCPNPLNKKSKGVLPVAVLGTENFDVTTIDPETIELTLEDVEEGVSPLRWNYEDVATPFEGKLCDCHELEGDGILDLTLKFDTQELVKKLALCDFGDGEEIPLTIIGNLKEEEGGTPIKGEDCILVLEKGKG